MFHLFGFASTVRRLWTPNDIPVGICCIPHPAASFLDYLQQFGAPAKLALNPPSPSQLPDAPTNTSGPFWTDVPLRPTYKAYHSRPLRYLDVYVDDFISACQGTLCQHLAALQTIFNTINKVFCLLSSEDPPLQQEPISVKKLGKGDATWSTQKVVLGWILDTVHEAISLLQRRLDRLHSILANLPCSKS